MAALNPPLNDQRNARSRALFVLAVALFPVLLTGLLTLAVFLSGAVKWDDGIGYKTDHASFEYPKDGDSVTDQFTAFGSVDVVPVGSVVYLVERADSRFWPKQRLGIVPGNFSRKHYVSEGKGYKYTIQLLALDPIALARVEEWGETGKRTGKYPGISDMSGAQVLAQVRVIR